MQSGVQSIISDMKYYLTNYKWFLYHAPKCWIKETITHIKAHA
jgi:hypothetical protein